MVMMVMVWSSLYMVMMVHWLEWGCGNKARLSAVQRSQIGWHRSLLIRFVMMVVMVMVTIWLAFNLQ